MQSKQGKCNVIKPGKDFPYKLAEPEFYVPYIDNLRELNGGYLKIRCTEVREEFVRRGYGDITTVTGKIHSLLDEHGHARVCDAYCGASGRRWRDGKYRDRARREAEEAAQERQTVLETITWGAIGNEELPADVEHMDAETTDVTVGDDTNYPVSEPVDTSHISFVQRLVLANRLRNYETYQENGETFVSLSFSVPAR